MSADNKKPLGRSNDREAVQPSSVTRNNGSVKGYNMIMKSRERVDAVCLYPYHHRRGKRYCHVSLVFGDGSRVSFSGQVALTLVMLQRSRCGGITQFSTLPYHTRLAASIHELRESGLQISTTREGESGHARYHLQSVGELIIHSMGHRLSDWIDRKIKGQE